MNWLEGLLYGFVSGLTEILPVSAHAHQHILLQLFGVRSTDAIADLVVHIASLFALLLGCRSMLRRLRREHKVAQRNKRHHVDIRSSYDLRLLRTAIVPMLLLMLGWFFTRRWQNNSIWIALFSVMNGLIIFMSERFSHGNKDSRHITIMDSILFGLFGALSVLPGISRIASAQAYASARGVDRQQSINWVLLLSIPALLVLCVFDIVTIAGGAVGVAGLYTVAGYILAAVGAFVGTYLSLLLIPSLVSRVNMNGFAFYSWGVAMLLLVLYLIS